MGTAPLIPAWVGLNPKIMLRPKPQRTRIHFIIRCIPLLTPEFKEASWKNQLGARLRCVPTIMQKRILLTATAVLFSLTLAAQAAEKKKSPFMTADADSDGKVSATEYSAAVKGNLDEAAAKLKFAELDKDKDGFLSREEFVAGAGGKKGEKKKKNATN